MGLIPNATVTMVKRAPMGDPIEVRIRSYELTLRSEEAKAIEIDEVRESPFNEQISIAESDDIFHPGYGEGGKYHN